MVIQAGLYFGFGGCRNRAWCNLEVSLCNGYERGGAFFLIFVAFTLLIGLPMLVSEFIIGRGSGVEAISAYKSWLRTVFGYGSEGLECSAVSCCFRFTVLSAAGC